MSDLLPREFAELEKFSEWILTGSQERNRKRTASSMAELKKFYDGMMPRMERILEYFSQLSLAEMPQDAKRLLYLCLSLAEISHAVELFGEPGVPGGLDPARFRVVVEPIP